MLEYEHGRERAVTAMTSHMCLRHTSRDFKSFQCVEFDFPARGVVSASSWRTGEGRRGVELKLINFEMIRI